MWVLIPLICSLLYAYSITLVLLRSLYLHKVPLPNSEVFLVRPHVVCAECAVMASHGGDRGLWEQTGGRGCSRISHRKCAHKLPERPAISLQEGEGGEGRSAHVTCMPSREELSLSLYLSLRAPAPAVLTTTFSARLLSQTRTHDKTTLARRTREFLMIGSPAHRTVCMCT